MLRLANQDGHAALLDLMEAFNRSEHIVMRREVTGSALARLLSDPTLGLVIVGDHRSAYAVLTWGFDLEFGGRDSFSSMRRNSQRSMATRSRSCPRFQRCVPSTTSET